MARITFSKDQPVQSLSGTAGNLTFRTMNGRTYVREHTIPALPKNPSRQQRAQHKQRTIIDNCLAILQSQIPDIQEAIELRPKFKERLRYLYKKFAKTIKAPTKLQKAIMTEYYANFSVTSPYQSRRIPEGKPNQSRAES